MTKKRMEDLMRLAKIKSPGRCCLKGFENSPPPRGWGVEVILAGSNFTVRQHSPRKVVEQIWRHCQVLGSKSPFKTDGDVWAYCNAIWHERAPNRSVLESGEVAPQNAKPAPRGAGIPQPGQQHWMTTPTEYGPIIWLWLNTFAMYKGFNKEEWRMTIERISRMLSPQKNYATGCSRCYTEWRNILKEMPPEKVSNETEAAQWVFDVHNRINYKLEKNVQDWNTVARKFAWHVALKDE